MLDYPKMLNSNDKPETHHHAGTEKEMTGVQNESNENHLYDHQLILTSSSSPAPPTSSSINSNTKYPNVANGDNGDDDGVNAKKKMSRTTVVPIGDVAIPIEDNNGQIAQSRPSTTSTRRSSLILSLAILDDKARLTFVTTDQKVDVSGPAVFNSKLGRYLATKMHITVGIACILALYEFGFKKSLKERQWDDVDDDGEKYHIYTYNNTYKYFSPSNKELIYF